MRSDRQAPVAIVGGGFSGTMVAAQLARRGIASVLIETTDRAGLGTAYSTREPAHVLNVRAEAMSAWADDPGHFAHFFEGQGGDPLGFAERRLFGRYLRSILDEAVASGCVSVVRGTAMAARPDGAEWLVELAGEPPLRASALVLAQGNQPPQPFAKDGPSARFIDNPWGEAAREAVEAAASSSAPVLLIGTGLTMVDMVLSLDAAAHQGRIIALSRRGLIPRGHADLAPSPVEQADVPHGSVTALWRWLRKRSAAVGWRAAIDALRPHSQSIWRSLDREQQDRFLRHARPWWDVHRHRIAPEVSERLRALAESGQLEVIAGRIAGIREQEDALGVQIRRRGRSEPESFHVAYAFNCTGPLGSIKRTSDPLLQQLLDAGLARPDSLGLGLDVDDGARVDGAARLWALGPLTKGRFWEIVAVPDIRDQAAQVAEDIAMELGR